MDTTITHEDIGEELRRIVIAGNLDTLGTNAISAELGELAAAPKRGVVVDLSAVQFVASIGIGQLILNAKAVKRRGGHMVLIAGAGVKMSLTMAGIDKFLPVFQSAPEAYVGALRGY